MTYIVRCRSGLFVALLSAVLLTGCFGFPLSKCQGIHRDFIYVGNIRVPKESCDLVPVDPEVVLRGEPAREGDPIALVGYRRSESPDSDVTCCIVVEQRGPRLRLVPIGDKVRTARDLFGSPDWPAKFIAQRDACRADIAAGKERKDVIDVSLLDPKDQRRIGPPLPEPGVILGVAANFWSHITADLKLDPTPDQKETIRRSAPRVFLKHGRGPRVSLNDGKGYPTGQFKGTIGPYDPIRYPETISFAAPGKGAMVTKDTLVDYEVEVGVVMAEKIEWSDINGKEGDALSEEVWKRVAGFVLVSDVKARNPQAYWAIAYRQGKTGSGRGERFAFHDREITEAFGGEWTRELFDVWSLAAAEGDYAAVGPIFVQRQGTDPFSTKRALAAARSYAGKRASRSKLPDELKDDRLYLRQAAYMDNDALVWGLPEIVRSILNPEDNYFGKGFRLDPGDIIALGTPAGVVITGRPTPFPIGLLMPLMPTDALYRKSIETNRDLFLHDGDRVFLWGEGLGFQVHDVTNRKL